MKALSMLNRMCARVHAWGDGAQGCKNERHECVIHAQETGGAAC